MFRGVDESAKKRALEDLKTYIWVHLAGMVGLDDDEIDSGWSIIALSPEFASKLEKSTGIDAQELPKLIALSANRFVSCLLRSIELANDGEPLRVDSLRELFVALGEIYIRITEEEVVYRRSLVVGRAEQELPLFLQLVAHRVRTLVEDYVLALVRDMEYPTDEFVADLLSQCSSSEEEEDLWTYLDQVNRRAEELFAADDTTEDKIFDELTLLISFLFSPEQ